MRLFLHSRIVLLFVLVFGSLLLNQHAGASTDVAVITTRSFEPAVQTGAELPKLLNASVDELFVVVSNAGVWTQIPFQVDELRSTGRRVATEDNIFDENDEIVFMAGDVGDDAGDVIPMVDGKPITGSYYRIRVSDPTEATETGWAYVVQAAGANQTFTQDYVIFKTSNNRVIGSTYKLGFTDTQQWFDYLVLGDGPDILDRTPKLRACINTLCITEQYPNLLGPQKLIKDGPVRVVLESAASSNAVNTEVLAYQSMTAWSINVNAPIAATTLSYVADHNAAAIGGTFYSLNTPTAGVPVDGVPDNAFSRAPVSPWWQISTDTGTIANVGDLTSAGGAQYSIFVDNADAAAEPNPATGEPGRYAESGILVNNPNQMFTYHYKNYYLAGRQPNIGTTFQNYFNHPLTATARLQTAASKVYIPLLIR